MPGRLFYELRHLNPMSMSLKEWEAALERALKHHEGWLGALLNETSAFELGYVVEQLVTECAMFRDKANARLEILRKAFPCPDCKGTGYTEMKPDFAGDNPKTMKIGTVSYCEQCKGQGFKH